MTRGLSGSQSLLAGDVTETVLDVLHYGYDPGCARGGLPDTIAATASPRTHSGDVETLIQMALDAFREAVDASMTGVADDATHVVPLSAGLDSRAILAALLDRPDVHRSDVLTVTYGSPGTWDFEIGQRIADVAAVRNVAVDLTADSLEWSLEALREYAAKRTCRGGIFDGYANWQASTAVPEDGVVWSGYTGGVTTGACLAPDPADDWATACATFAEREAFATGLTPPDYDPTAVLPTEPFLPRSHLSFEEQLDFALRQQCATGPVVLTATESRFPFARPAWLEFSLNLPRSYRRHRSLFAEAFSTAYPDLFSLPTDATAGHTPTTGRLRQLLTRARLRVQAVAAGAFGREFTHPATNYLDFEEAFRSGELRAVGRTLTSEFARRGAVDWFDPTAVWQDHRAGADRTNEILAICHAELSLSELRDRQTERPGPLVAQ